MLGTLTRSGHNRLHRRLEIRYLKREPTDAGHCTLLIDEVAFVECKQHLYQTPNRPEQAAGHIGDIAPIRRQRAVAVRQQAAKRSSQRTRR